MARPVQAMCHEGRARGSHVAILRRRSAREALFGPCFAEPGRAESRGMAAPSVPNVSPFPRPRRVLTTGSSWLLPTRVVAAGLGSSELPSLSWLTGALRARGHVLERSPGVSEAVLHVHRDPNALARRLAANTALPGHASEQGYVLTLASGEGKRKSEMVSV